jgi:hypothetical protein
MKGNGTGNVIRVTHRRQPPNPHQRPPSARRVLVLIRSHARAVRPQLALVMTAASGLPVEKRGLFLERVAVRLTLRGRFNDADLDEAVRVALRGLIFAQGAETAGMWAFISSLAAAAAVMHGARKEIAAKLNAEEWARSGRRAYLDAASAAVLPPSRLNRCSTAQG